MKTNTKHPKRLAIALAGGLAMAALPTVSQATILGGVHDFRSKTWNSSEQICKVCHIPHNGPGATEAPLFNHQLTTTSPFTAYTSGTLDAVVGQPTGVSKACLSCHDGTVALNAFGGNQPIAGGAINADTQKMGANHPTRDLGTDLSNDHPVSFTFDTALSTADGGLIDPTTLPPELRLFNGTMHCATCHDVHQTRGSAAVAGNKLLVRPLADSALCLTCHTK